MIHCIERSSPTPLSISSCLFFQLSATRRWSGRVNDAKTAFLQSPPTTRKNKLVCTMPIDWTFPRCTSEQLIMLETEVYGLVSGPAWWRKSFLEVVLDLGYRINPYDRCVLTLDSKDRSSHAPTERILIIEVDDMLESGGEIHQRKMKLLQERLRFGKAVELREVAAGLPMLAGGSNSWRIILFSTAWMTMWPIDFDQWCWKRRLCWRMPRPLFFQLRRKLSWEAPLRVWIGLLVKEDLTQQQPHQFLLEVFQAQQFKQPSAPTRRSNESNPIEWLWRFMASQKRMWGTLWWPMPRLTQLESRNLNTDGCKV